MGHFFYKLQQVTDLFIKKFPIILLVLPAVQQAYSQGDDFNHTQFQNTYLLTNPAMVAAQRNAQLLFTYRNQPNASGRNFTNAMLTGVYPLINRKTCNRWGGIGATLIHDQNSDFLESNVAMLAFAYNLKVDENKLGSNFLSLGVQGALFQRSINLNGLTTSSQYLDGVFVSSLDINEFNENTRQTFGAFSLGGLWYATDSLNENSAFVGLSVYNINTPQNSFYERISSTLPVHTTLTAGWRIVNKPKYSIVPTAKWIRRTGNNEVLGGGWLNYRLFQRNSREDNPPKTGMAGVGLWYNFNNAFVASLQWQQDRYFVTMSFDVPTKGTSNIWQGSNAFEITLGLNFHRKCKDNRYSVEPVQTIFKLPESKPKIEENQLALQKVEVPPIIPKKPEPKTKPGLEDGAFRFKFNSNELDDRSKEILDSVSRVLNENPNVIIDISGHTCDIGSAEANLLLSKRRTETVKKYLVEQYHIDPKRITTEAFGESRPLVPNTDEANRIINRRVAFKLRYKDE